MQKLLTKNCCCCSFKRDKKVVFTGKKGMDLLMVEALHKNDVTVVKRAGPQCRNESAKITKT